MNMRTKLKRGEIVMSGDAVYAHGCFAPVDEIAPDTLGEPVKTEADRTSADQIFYSFWRSA